MKTITPISIWDNGTTQEATILNACCISDNLKSYASFFYTLLGNSMQQLAQGNLSMSNEDYIDWQTNDYAYNWVANKLNLTITGDYVPPVPPVPPVPGPPVEPTTTTTSTTTENVVIE